MPKIHIQNFHWRIFKLIANRGDFLCVIRCKSKQCILYSNYSPEEIENKRLATSNRIELDQKLKNYDSGLINSLSRILQLLKSCYRGEQSFEYSLKFSLPMLLVLGSFVVGSFLGVALYFENIKPLSITFAVIGYLNILTTLFFIFWCLNDCSYNTDKRIMVADVNDSLYRLFAHYFCTFFLIINHFAGVNVCFSVKK